MQYHIQWRKRHLSNTAGNLTRYTNKNKNMIRKMAPVAQLVRATLWYKKGHRNNEKILKLEEDELGETDNFTQPLALLKYIFLSFVFQTRSLVSLK